MTTLERQKILSNDLMEQRMRKFGKTIGTWICDNCKDVKKSFLYNYETHIPSICDICNIGNLIENEFLREKQTPSAMTKSKQGEDAWMSKQSVETQASILLGDDPKY